jgi:predicted nuclease with TOPRIM domain
MQAARYNPRMSEGDRAAPLTTACDDLQAQLEAGDRTFRHLTEDLGFVSAALRDAALRVETFADLQRHIQDLRGNMREQRAALREVRRAARKLCDSVTQAREQMLALADENRTLEMNNAQLLADDAQLRDTARDFARDKGDDDLLRD